MNKNPLPTIFMDLRHLQTRITQATFESYGGSAGKNAWITVTSPGSTFVVGCADGENSSSLLLEIDVGRSVLSKVIQPYSCWRPIGTPCADLGGLFRPLTAGIAFLSRSQVCPDAGKWVSPNKLERQALKANILFVVKDHCPTPSCSLRACSGRPEVFRFASISFIAAMSRISASVNCRVVFCVILNMIGIVLIHARGSAV